MASLCVLAHDEAIFTSFATKDPFPDEKGIDH